MPPALLGELLEHHPEGVILFDPEFRILFANAAARRISRIEPQHIASLTHWEIYPETVGTVVEETYRRVQRSRIAQQLPDFYYAPFDVWVRVRALPLGKGFAVYYQDVSLEHNLSDDKLASEARLHFALEAANCIGAWEWDIPNDSVRSDPAFANVYGVSPEDAAKGVPIAQFTANIHPDDIARATGLIEDALRTGSKFIAEYRLLQPDGSHRWVSARGHVVLDEQGRPARFPGVAIDITEQKAAAEAARINEERLRLAMTAIRGVGAYDWDVPNDLVYGDKRFAEICGIASERFVTGIAREEFAGHIHPEDRAAMDEAVQAVLSTGGDFSTQYRVLPPGAETPRWVAIRGHAELAPDGAPLRFRGVVVDITAEKRRDEQLRLSEERYRILVERSPISKWIADANGLVRFANQRFLDYIGHEFEPKIGDEFILAFYEEDRQRVLDLWKHSVETGENYDIEARLLRASDGAVRWWHLSALPVRNNAGVIQQWLGIATDIHEIRLATEERHKQYDEIDRRRRELEAIYNGSPIGMALYEPKELRLTRINARQAEIFRMSPEQAMGQRYEDLAAGVPAALSLIRRAAAGEFVLNHPLEGVLSRRPEEHRYWNISYSPIFAEDGSVQAIAAATVETTFQRQGELALIQSEKLAAVGRMAASIAHEINNPLEAVTNLIFLARSYAIIPEVQQFLDLAEQELRRVSVIANQTLRFHKQATRPTECRAEDLFDNVLSLYEGKLRNSGIEALHTKRSDLAFSCFEGDIRQVLSNLIGNAIDAMPSRGRLFLRSRNSRDWRTGAPGITMTIADTGTGIPPETLKRIFEPFYTTKGFNGTGLGLWISTEIIERHHGRLRVRSSQSPEHHGTVFTIFLPFETQPDAGL